MISGIGSTPEAGSPPSLARTVQNDDGSRRRRRARGPAPAEGGRALVEEGDTGPGSADDSSPGSPRPETDCRTVNLLWLIAHTTILYHDALGCALRSRPPAYGLHA